VPASRERDGELSCYIIHVPPSASYRQNHYVPQWYQKRFMLHGQHNLFVRDLKPRRFRDASGREHVDRELRSLAPRQSFVERDLYTTYLGSEPSTEIERLFFGRIDSAGKAAVEAFSNFTVAGALAQYDNLLAYLGSQKFRTPKGLRWIAEQAGSADRHRALVLMMSNRAMYHAVWSECVWSIVDAAESSTKFIVSDHPVTVYNRSCGPSSDRCRGYSDPDVRLNATHTLYALSIDRMLVLTNLTWARNPYQDPCGLRPNPQLSRMGLFKAMGVQRERHLTEIEVHQINFILKSRALRYVAAAVPEWLYPEKRVSKSDWRNFGDGYLLMPDPRPIHSGGTVYMTYEDGTSLASDEYGRLPGQPGFEDKQRSELEWNALHRFKGEFARLYGPVRRGRTNQGLELEAERTSDETHEYYLSLEEQHRPLMRGVRNW